MLKQYIDIAYAPIRHDSLSLEIDIKSKVLVRCDFMFPRNVKSNMHCMRKGGTQTGTSDFWSLDGKSSYVMFLMMQCLGYKMHF